MKIYSQNSLFNNKYLFSKATCKHVFFGKTEPFSPSSLSRQELDEIYEKRIRQDLLVKSSKSSKPKLTVVTGNMGAGKSYHVENVLKNDNVLIDVDELRKFHPDYKNLMSQGNEGKDFCRKAAYYWKERLLNDLEKEPRNAIYTISTLNNHRINEIKNIRKAGYSVELRYILTSGIESETSVYKRFEQQLKQTDIASFIPYDERRKAANSLFMGIRQLLDSNLIDNLKAYTRESKNIPVFERTFPFVEDKINNRSEHILRSISENLTSSLTPIQLPILSPETFHHPGFKDYIKKDDRSALEILEKQVENLNSFLPREPLPITIGEEEYLINAVAQDHLKLVNKKSKNIFIRFYQVGELGLSAEKNGKLYNIIIPNTDELVLQNTSTGESDVIKFPKNGKDYSLSVVKDVKFFKNDQSFQLSKISSDTKLVCFEPVKQVSVKKMDENDLPKKFEALLKGEIRKGAHKIIKVSSGLLAQSPDSKNIFKIKLSDISESLKDFYHDEAGTIKVSLLKHFLDQNDSKTLPKHRDLQYQDKSIGSLKYGTFSIGNQEFNISQKVSFLKSLSDKFDTFICMRGFSLDKEREPLKDFIEWAAKNKSSTSNAKKHVFSNLRLAERTMLPTQIELEKLGFVVNNPFTYPGISPPVVPHAKIIVGRNDDGQAKSRLDTACFNYFPGFDKIDIGLELPKYPSSLLYYYLSERNNFNFNLFTTKQRLESLAKSGVLINDPKANTFMVTRGINQLTREANGQLSFIIGDLKDENFADLLLKQLKRGIKISIIVHAMDKRSAEKLYPVFFPKKEISLDAFWELLSDKLHSHEFEAEGIHLVKQQRRKDSSEESPTYIHSNIVICDNKKILIGTAYPWTNMSYNRILPDGPSLESAFVAEGKMATNLIAEINKYKQRVLKTSFNPNFQKSLHNKNIENIIVHQPFEFTA